MFKFMKFKPIKILARSFQSKDTVDFPSYKPQFEVSQYVDILVKEGFKKHEAESLVQLTQEVIQESMESSTKLLITKKDQQRFNDDASAQLRKIRTDIHVLEQKDFGFLKSSLENIKSDVEKMNHNIRDEIKRVQSGIRLDMNLEKSRIKMESNDLKTQLSETERKIDEQLDKLEKRLQIIKSSTKTGVRNFLLTGCLLTIFGKLFIRHYDQSEKAISAKEELE